MLGRNLHPSNSAKTNAPLNEIVNIAGTEDADAAGTKRLTSKEDKRQGTRTERRRAQT